jgi:hypothetical protein
VNAIHSEDWRAPIAAVIKGYYEAEDGVIGKRVAIRAMNYHIIDGNLYRKGVCVSGILPGYSCKERRWTPTRIPL